MYGINIPQLGRFPLIETLAYDYGQDNGVGRPHQKSSSSISYLCDHFLAACVFSISLERQ